MSGGECAQRENRGRTWRGGQLNFRSVVFDRKEDKIKEPPRLGMYLYCGERGDF